jgi:hypothetical protein
MLSQNSVSPQRSFWRNVVNGFASAGVLMFGNAVFFWLGLFGDSRVSVAPYAALVACAMVLPWLVMKLRKK